MRDEYLKHPFDAYPYIFADADSNGMTGPPQSERFSCGDGWSPIIEALCGGLQCGTDQNGESQILLQQVKEAFGTLRVGAFASH